MASCILCGRARDTVMHILHECEAVSVQRNELFSQLWGVPSANSSVTDIVNAERHLQSQVLLGGTLARRTKELPEFSIRILQFFDHCYIIRWKMIHLLRRMQQHPDTVSILSLSDQADFLNILREMLTDQWQRVSSQSTDDIPTLFRGVLQWCQRQHRQGNSSSIECDSGLSPH